MWIVRWVIIALLILIVLGFALQNQEQTVSVRILRWQSPVLPLYLFLYLSFGAGLLFWVLISALNTIKLRGEIFKLNRENRKIREELNRLRNVSIEDDIESPASGEDEMSMHAEP
jgi:uncharacterized integral membrane protein